MVNWGARTKDQYANLAEVMGFRWRSIGGRSFASAYRHAKKMIDAGSPVILGILDMYHLPYYEKFYHRFHVPYHFVLMVGYDEESQAALVQDCGRSEVERVPLDDLRAAWDVKSSLTKPNSLYEFDFDERLSGTLEMAERALLRHSRRMLQPPASMLGIPGMRKLAKELPGWPQDLDEKRLHDSLMWLVEFTGNPPLLPPRLMGGESELNDHSGARQGFGQVLDSLAETCAQPAWAETGALLRQSGGLIGEITELVVDMILGAGERLEDAGRLLARAADLEEAAYRKLAVSA